MRCAPKSTRSTANRRFTDRVPALGEQIWQYSKFLALVVLWPGIVSIQVPTTTTPYIDNNVFIIHCFLTPFEKNMNDTSAASIRPFSLSVPPIIRVLWPLLLTNFTAISNEVLAVDSHAPRACRSVHLWWQEAEMVADGRPVEAVAFYNEVIVEESTRGTYFMACGFSKGYFGIQELYNGKKIVLFSVWEPGKQNNPNATPQERRVKTIASGKGVRVKRFGGEGTGGQSFYDYAWKVGEIVRFVVFAKPELPDRTQYAGYVYIPNENRWQHMATFSTLANGHLLRGFYSFVEDFLRNGKSAQVVHRASFGNGWVQRQSHDGIKWLPLTKARFTADRTPTMNIDSGAIADRIFLQTGGDTKNENTKLRESIILTKAERKPPLDLPKPFVEEVASKHIRILSYNVKHGRGNDNAVDLARTANVIRRLNPDVVALQEVDNRAERSGKVDQAKELAERTGLRYHAFGPFFEFQGGQYGMAIISRYPLTDVTNVRLPDGAEPRTSLVSRVAAPTPFQLANVHFYRTEKERLAQSKTLLRFLQDKQELPSVIAGDFNSKPDSTVLREFSVGKFLGKESTASLFLRINRPSKSTTSSIVPDQHSKFARST